MQLSPRQRIGFYNHVFKTLRRAHHLELEALLKTYIPEDGVVFDVGGHVGQFAKLFSRLAPKGQVYTFEPSLYARNILQIMAGVKFFPNLYVLPFGLSNKPERAVIHTPVKKNNSLSLGLAFVGDAGKYDRKTMTHDILLSTIDDVCRSLNLQRLDFIKADIEGSEMRMLEGARESVKKFKPVVFFEIDHGSLARNSHTSDDIFKFFEDAGYRTILRIVEGTGDVITHSFDDRSHLIGDFLFVP